MNRAALHEGLRQMRFKNLLDRHKGKEITSAEAAKILGVRERTFRRWTELFEDEGEAGLHERCLGGPSPKRAPAEEIDGLRGFAEFTPASEPGLAVAIAGSNRLANACSAGFGLQRNPRTSCGYYKGAHTAT